MVDHTRSRCVGNRRDAVSVITEGDILYVAVREGRPNVALVCGPENNLTGSSVVADRSKVVCSVGKFDVGTRRDADGAANVLTRRGLDNPSTSLGVIRKRSQRIGVIGQIQRGTRSQTVGSAGAGFGEVKVGTFGQVTRVVVFDTGNRTREHPCADRGGGDRDGADLNGIAASGEFNLFGQTLFACGSTRRVHPPDEGSKFLGHNSLLFFWLRSVPRQI